MWDVNWDGFCLGLLNVFLPLLKELFLVGSFCFLDSSLFHVAASNDAGFEFVKFARGCLFCFEDKFDWDNQFIFSGFYTKDKSFVINEVLDFHFNSM